MAKLIKLEEVQRNTKKFYEVCSDISVLQKELDQMLTAIEKNSIDFGRGKISRDLFKYNDDKMKRESAAMIKKINKLVESGVSLVSKVNREVAKQKTEPKERRKRKKIKEIKKRLKKRKKVKRKKIKRKKKAKPAPKTTAATPSEATQAPTPTPAAV